MYCTVLIADTDLAQIFERTKNIEMMLLHETGVMI